MSEATVIALGFFDGVHLGHGALLRKTAERARELGVTPAAFTFDRSPKEFVTGVPVPLLTSAAERAEILREYYGIGTAFVQPFHRARRCGWGIPRLRPRGELPLALPRGGRRAARHQEFLLRKTDHE